MKTYLGVQMFADQQFFFVCYFFETIHVVTSDILKNERKWYIEISWIFLFGTFFSKAKPEILKQTDQVNTKNNESFTIPEYINSENLSRTTKIVDRNQNGYTLFFTSITLISIFKLRTLSIVLNITSSWEDIKNIRI